MERKSGVPIGPGAEFPCSSLFFVLQMINVLHMQLIYFKPIFL